jgi:hypothetical protein
VCSLQDAFTVGDGGQKCSWVGQQA